MDTWLLISLTLFLALLLGFVLRRRSSCDAPNQKQKRKRKLPLPPGPPAVPVLGNLLWLRRSFTEVEPILRELRARYGPVVSLRVGTRLMVFVFDRALAHHALVARGAAFASRPAPLPAARFLSVNAHNITSAPYGPLWRLLRRNLVAETLHPSRVTLFAPARSWVLRLLLSKLRADAQDESGASVAVMGHFQFAMFALLVLMCFGEKLDEEAVEDIGDAQRSLLLYGRKLQILAFAPWITKHLFRKRRETALEMRRRQTRIYVPLIQARRGRKPESEGSFAHSYVDTLLGITLADEGGRALTDDEMVALCSEFLNAGTDTTSTALQWIMAELVKNPRVQDRLRAEIEQVVGTRGADEDSRAEVKEEELQRMPYLKAVVLEGLRRHPPAHFVLPHAVTEEEEELGGYAIPKRASINFMVADMGWDEEAWEAPMEFRPERFVEGGEGADVDVTGSRVIKMMPFGAGRRICAGINIAMLHLEYFVANMVREFEWREVEGEEVDFAEKNAFTVVMKHPLKARLFPTRKNN